MLLKGIDVQTLIKSFLKKAGIGLVVGFLIVGGSAKAQVARPQSAAAILHQMKRLNVLGSVLYVAAHPDDENTRLIAWLSNHKQYRTGYLSLTRGDGGQNLIGDEQGVELGMIRSQELLAARRIDGGEQFFTRAFDFGFSKSPEEAFEKWNHEQVLADAVWIVRRFQPDVVVARFPEDARAGHGHHSASGIIAREVFDAAADPKRFPEQLKYGVTAWKVKRVLWNTFNFGGGSNTIDSTQFQLEVGDYSPLLGQSLGELAGESRSQHKSQGFGVSRQRGSAKEFFTPIKGDRPQKDLLDGVNTTWSRLEGGAGMEALVDTLVRTYNMENPAASLPLLQKLMGEVAKMPYNTWQQAKLKAIQELMLSCAGVYMEATTAKPGILPNDSVAINISVINRSTAQVTLKRINVGTTQWNNTQALTPNRSFNANIKTLFGLGVLETQPYWLREPQETGTYTVTDQLLIGLPENKPLAAELELNINGAEILVRQPIQFRYVDPVKAEQYQPVYLTHPYLIYNNPGILLFRKNSNDTAQLRMHITANATGNLAAPAYAIKSSGRSWLQSGKTEAWNPAPGEQKVVTVTVPNYMKGTQAEQDVLEVSVLPGGAYGKAEYSNARRSIVYDHIPTQTWHYRDQVKVLHIDLKTAGKRIGYLPGAGDRVSGLLEQMGYEVTTLGENDLTINNLRQFDAVVTGVRAYNVHDYLANAYPALMQYVFEGGNLVVQYNTSNFISTLKGKIAPYAFSIGRSRITDENSEVKLLLPNHPVLNYPNKITAKDFTGWVQERSIYHADGLDSAKWQMPLGMQDPNEPIQNGSLAIAPYGKGNFVYTGIVFFRQLPAGAPGAFRLLANIIALPKRKS